MSLVATAALAVGPEKTKLPARNFDARAALDAPVAKSSLAQAAALETLRAQVGDLAVERDQRTGATHSLYNRTGYLTEPMNGTARSIALDYVRENAAALGLSPADLNGFEITDMVESNATGATHVYLRQRARGLAVYNGQLHVNVNRDGRVLSVNNAFVPDLDAKLQGTHPAVGAGRAVASAMAHLGRQVEVPAVLDRGDGPEQRSLVAHEGLSRRAIDAGLMWLPVGDDVRLVWNFQIHDTLGPDIHDLTVDAETGAVWTRFNWHSLEQYRVYPLPIESPNHTTPLPPADARTLEINPADATASPLGWHDTGSTSYTITRGNNVHAFEDLDGNQSPGTETDCGVSLDCDFPMDLSQAPSTYSDASAANVFYWTNIIHDIQYHYGFDEAAGNFQENNFGNGGSGGDYVLAQAQSGYTSPTFSCPGNAGFSTPPDGSNGSMIMCLWTAPNPDRDGDFDHGIVAHEFGHGISNRQVGGPSNVSCLNNNQAGGEGWSDFLSLWYTARVGDQGTDGRGVGTYALNQPTTGSGIRTQRYSTDPAINNHTYESIQGMAVPHGVGEVWAQALWEVYWALVDQHGFDADLYNVAGGAGNHRAMLYVNEGFKNTACSPTFTDARDGIIQAAVDNFSGEDVCRVWEAFAAFGLGTDAVSGGSSSTSPTNGFEIPVECQCSPSPIADAGPDVAIQLGNSVQIGTPAQPDNSYSWAPGGETTAQITVSPTETTVYTVTASTLACGSDNDSVTVTVYTGNGPQDAAYDGGLGAPACAIAGSECDSLSLLDSRGNLSPAEPNQPNTLDSCTDGSTGTYHTDESLDRLVVSTLDGSDFTEGETVRIDATVWAWSTGSSDSLDLYSTGDANNPVWQYITTLTPNVGGQQTLSTTYTLPAGSLQAIRGNFRYNGSVSSCSTGGYDDADDLVFPVTAAGNNDAPVVTITAPGDGASFDEGDNVGFAGTANDTEDGDISGDLTWSSDLDGAIGSGASFSTTGLSAGAHTITASVTDSGNASGSNVISVTIVPNAAPVVTITAPSSGTTVTEGDNVGFAGTANDAEDGDLSASLSWSSNLDGAIGSGASFSTTGLSVGTHTITASVVDSLGAPGSDSVTVTVDPPAGALVLSANGYKVKGVHTIDLTWTGGVSANVDIVRNGQVVATTANDGAYTDSTGNKGGGVTYQMQVCVAGTSTCSNVVAVVY